ncbi:ABC transporter permease subunit [Rubinisphaera sp.]|uniref:ABC transporter permease n=1 Tax=Rubinisphaera sp. TaxID=2024857 RepID=UPI000C0CC287|nr:ABC transporter permease subunit [Rubinisphaera sp.]MBV10721.1 ABC transporter permease [Rubinisphaera sp.]HCS53601.1 ABC transporter permease [Planctomycetaceae bacterium]|tara:strand:+ start:9532 stop:11145 length:1614 start_codon:yes stop_codon:yes gene_type:complete
MERFKYSLLKIINISGLTFLEPVVRLCYGEEPRLQLKKIGRFIVIPAVTFMIFIWMWSIIAPVYKTKSGEVPTPAVVYEAARGVREFHDRETDKQTAYSLDGQDREASLDQVQEELKAITAEKVKADAEVMSAEIARKAFITEKLEPLKAEYETKKEEFLKAQLRRDRALKIKAAKVEKGDLQGKNNLLGYVRGHQEQTAAELDELAELKTEQDDVRNLNYPPLLEALKFQTDVAEQEQYLTKKEEILSKSNRSLKLDEEEDKLKQLQRQYASATGPDLIPIAQQMLRVEERMNNISSSEYAKPWTLPMQIARSVACVFAGFFLATAIAIPIGILCGVSSTFMAAVTPFIALFKPVSPIVWLPISLIIVGGIITDPDKHWLMVALSEMPLIGWLQINPAFIASAITVALCSLWPTLVNTALGVASIDKDHINVARVLRLTFTQRLFKIVIPSALPLIFAGLRISLGVGWMVLIAAELLSSSEGIGKFVWDMFNNGSSETFAQMFVVVFVVGAIGLLLDRTMIVFQRLVSFDGAPAAI